MKYPPNFVQSLGADAIARLPPDAMYEGDAEDLQHLRGRSIPTTDVEQMIYVGERENVWVEGEHGTRWRPWKECWITELDEHGNVVVKGYGEDAAPLPALGPRAMDSHELKALGFNDAMLADLARDELGVEYEPERPGKSNLRREIFDRVMARLYG